MSGTGTDGSSVDIDAPSTSFNALDVCALDLDLCFLLHSVNFPCTLSRSLYSHLHTRNLSLFRLPLLILKQRINLYLPQPQPKTLVLTLLIHNPTRARLLLRQKRHALPVQILRRQRLRKQPTVHLRVHRAVNRLLNTPPKRRKPMFMLQHNRLLIAHLLRQRSPKHLILDQHIRLKLPHTAIRLAGAEHRTPLRAHEPRHMKDRLDTMPPQRKRNHSLTMTVHDALRVRKFLKHRPVDETLAVALRRGRVYGRRVGDPVGDEVGAGFDERGRAGVVGGNQVLGFVHRVADGDVAEGIDEALLVQDVVCADDEAEGLEEGGGDGGRHFVDGVCVCSVQKGGGFS